MFFSVHVCYPGTHSFQTFNQYRPWLHKTTVIKFPGKFWVDRWNGQSITLTLPKLCVMVKQYDPGPYFRGKILQKLCCNWKSRENLGLGISAEMMSHGSLWLTPCYFIPRLGPQKYFFGCPPQLFRSRCGWADFFFKDLFFFQIKVEATWKYNLFFSQWKCKQVYFTKKMSSNKF